MTKQLPLIDHCTITPSYRNKTKRFITAGYWHVGNAG